MEEPPSTSRKRPMPNAEVFLSRHAYPLGSALVGTLLFSPSDNSSSSSQDLRKSLKSVVVYAAGFCRVDSRWHKVADYTKIYGTSHPFLQSLNFDKDLIAPPAADETVCFWATNGLELLDLKERTVGKSLEEDDNILAFTFRVDIPLDLPHSIHSSTCRYHYTADVLIQTETQQRVIKTPFEVWANPQEPPPQSRDHQKQHSIAISGARVKFGSIYAMAHSCGWPCHLTATELNRPRGAMSVARPRRLDDDVQSLRVSNALGQFVCMTTVIGGKQLTPGSHVHLQWDFHDEADIPCVQVAACLVGEEWALYEDGTRTKAQSYIFDTCHAWVHPGNTLQVAESMLLPSDAPCVICTDIMELSIRCQIDITVQENGKYNNLRIELPCHVVHKLEDKTEYTDPDEEMHSMSLSELLGIPPNPEFPQTNILPDLTTLSLEMEERVRKIKGQGRANPKTIE